MIVEVNKKNEDMKIWKKMCAYAIFIHHPSFLVI